MLTIYLSVHSLICDLNIISVDRIGLVISLFFLLINVTQVSAQRELLLETTTLTEREVAIGLEVPWEMKWGPDEYIWLTERPGRMKRIKPRTGNVTEILDLTSVVGNFSESGMLGFCFHPDFEDNQLIYLCLLYTSPSPRDS